jgi:uncharacterized membrane protein YfbV (UPF0208 family)
MKAPQDPIFIFRTDKERRIDRVARIVQRIMQAVALVGLCIAIYYAAIGCVR